MTSGSGNAFLTGPLSIPANVTLVIDQGVTLYGSRNPADYGSGCGTAGSKSGACLPLISVKDNNAGVMGIRTGGRQGTIDGRGDQTMLGKSTTWWEFGENAKKSNQVQNSPDLIKVQNSSEFTLYDVNLINAAYFHFFSHIVNGLTVWGVRVKSPASSPNTDGLDLDSVVNATIHDSDVMGGDDCVAIKTIAYRSANITVRNSRCYGTHGISIGREVMSGVSNVLVDNNALVSTDDAGNRSTDNNGLRIKTSIVKGGPVSQVTYRNTCPVRGDKPGGDQPVLCQRQQRYHADLQRHRRGWIAQRQRRRRQGMDPARLRRADTAGSGAGQCGHRKHLGDGDRQQCADRAQQQRADTDRHRSHHRPGTGQWRDPYLLGRSRLPGTVRHPARPSNGRVRPAATAQRCTRRGGAVANVSSANPPRMRSCHAAA